MRGGDDFGIVVWFMFAVVLVIGAVAWLFQNQPWVAVALIAIAAVSWMFSRFFPARKH